jgi:hypothetical protein
VATTQQFVVRGGVASARQLRAGTRSSANGHGFSVQTAPGLSAEDLALGARYPNRQISVSTLSALTAVGVFVRWPTPGAGARHGTVLVPEDASDDLFARLAATFSPRTNPFPTFEN